MVVIPPASESAAVRTAVVAEAADFRTAVVAEAAVTAGPVISLSLKFLC